MASRIELQMLLEELLGSRNVYYQPPGEMKYPCIKYSRSDINTVKADDINYLMTKRYELIVISRFPDHPVIEKLLELQASTYDRQYISDNLYHDVITLYY